MLFKDLNLEVTEMLKIKKDDKMSFHVVITEPVETRQHMIMENNNQKIVECLYNVGKVEQCPYCITSKTLLKHNPSCVEAKQMIARKRFHLPVELDDGSVCVFAFGKKIRDAYMQLLTACTMYRFDGTNLIFNHNITSDEHTFVNYDTCSFTFTYSPGKKKKKLLQTITVGRLCKDEYNSQYGFIQR